jgi:hypothetical protein
LEGGLVKQISSPIGANEMALIDHTVIDNVFRVTTGILPPQDLVRKKDTANVITAASGGTLTLTTPLPAGLVYPVRFTTTGALPTTSPQILALRTYFIWTTTGQIFNSAVEAASQTNPFGITNNGSGTNDLITLNNWSIGDANIVNYPVFDFNEVDYSAITFLPGAASGYNITLTASSPIFTLAHKGGSFSGGGGIARILGIVSTTVAAINIVQSFTTPVVAIPGSLSFLTEPAWSADRGWPRVCSSFQNRAFFANTDLLPNGLWGSVTNTYNDFDDIQLDADNAISWYPTSDDVNFIRFIVPYRSLTIHTNSGIYSTPLSVETAITPSNFSLTLQDSTPAEFVQPRGIDNQIIILSGNDAHSLLWDGFNNAYNSNIISIANEQLIRNPVDEAAYTDLDRAGSRYMLIVNEDGSLAIYQTLISEDVQGFTPAILEQYYGNAYFRWVTTNFDGRGWFVTEREIATQQSAINITAFTSSTLTAVASNFDTTRATAVQFTTTGTVPASTPALALATWYWVYGVTADTFNVYITKEDADTGSNQVVFTSAGNNSKVVPWKLVTNFFIEELSFQSKMDCCYNYSGSPQSTFTGLTSFNAQKIYANGDGYSFNNTGINSSYTMINHGIITEVSKAQIGFPINVTIEPLPLSIYAGTTKQSNLVTPTHIRDVIFMFADTIGGYINDIPILLQTFDEFAIDRPPEPVNGLFEYAPMTGWDDFKNIGLVITHSSPFDFKLIGIFYKVEA